MQRKVRVKKRVIQILSVAAGLLMIVLVLIRRTGLRIDSPAAASQPAAARAAEVLLLSPSRSPEIWRVSSDGQERTQLTSTGGRVYDYAVSADGSQIVYSVKNDQQGMDLWEIDRQGLSQRELLPCGADWCVNPAISPDSAQIAYTRRQASGLPGSQPGRPRIWLLDHHTLATDLLSGDPNMSGEGPAWSPDGRYLAFVDAAGGGVRVLDWQAKKSFLFSAQNGTGLEWSPDSRKLLYTGYTGAAQGDNESLPSATVLEADVQTRQVKSILNGAAEPEDFSVPAWSPDGQRLAVASRPLTGSAGKRLWTVNPDGSQPQTIAGDPLAAHSSYHWSPDSAFLVFQRLKLGDSDSQPEVLVWDRNSGKTTLLAEDAFQPRWLP